MEAVKLGDRHGDHLFQIAGCDDRGRESAYDGFFDREIVAHDRVHDRDQLFAVAEPEGVRLGSASRTTV